MGLFDYLKDIILTGFKMDFFFRSINKFANAIENVVDIIEIKHCKNLFNSTQPEKK